MIHPAEDLLDDVFHALSNRTRRALLHRLAEGPARVTELAAPHGMTVNGQVFTRRVVMLR
jgi:DNA-binding transcriptional ArsR family regulator